MRRITVKNDYLQLPVRPLRLSTEPLPFIVRFVLNWYWLFVTATAFALLSLLL